MTVGGRARHDGRGRAAVQTFGRAILGHGPLRRTTASAAAGADDSDMDVGIGIGIGIA
ncbi:hypothetical protein ACIPC1_10215 [Streptomyces sp. NPDC087263]|uniref:hypothetical protein n=1 Tax=Streptomyces sp. NPDC087263 TaxID=3365773 RepID=UPI00381AD921